MKRIEPLLAACGDGSDLLNRCRSLWDLDQLIGEMGWDDEQLKITFRRTNQPIVCFGREVKGTLHPDTIPCSEIERIERQKD